MTKEQRDTLEYLIDIYAAAVGIAAKGYNAGTANNARQAKTHVLSYVETLVIK
jgi:hypothetical protein